MNSVRKMAADTDISFCGSPVFKSASSDEWNIVERALHRDLVILMPGVKEMSGKGSGQTQECTTDVVTEDGRLERGVSIAVMGAGNEADGYLDEPDGTEVSQMGRIGPHNIDSGQVCAVTSRPCPHTETTDLQNIRAEQQRDPMVKELSQFLSSGKLPENETRARKMALQSSMFSLVDGVVYHIDHKTRKKCAVVPSHLQEKLLRETHAGNYSGHFSGRRLYDTLRMSWWWDTMFADGDKFAKSCPECIYSCHRNRT